MTNNDYIQSKCDSYNNMSGKLKYYDCPTCKNKGDIAFIKDDDIAFKKCSCRNIRRSKQILQNCGLEKQVEKCTFDNFEVKSNYQKILKIMALEYLTVPDSWFMACGQVGSGKTHICTAILADLINKGNYSLYMNWRDETVKLKRAANEEGYTQIDKFKKCGVLYIDDLFKGKVTDADIGIAFEIINHRYNENLKTIISSERSLDNLLSIDQAIASRIKEKTKNKYLIQIAYDDKKNYRMK